MRPIKYVKFKPVKNRTHDNAIPYKRQQKHKEQYKEFDASQTNKFINN